MKTTSTKKKTQPLKAAKKTAKKAPLKAAKKTAKKTPLKAAKKTPLKAAKKTPLKVTKKAPVKAKKSTLSGNKKVASIRGNSWKKNLMKAKLESKMNPAKMKLIRIEIGLSQPDIAKKLGLTHSTFSSIETRQRLVKESRSVEIADILKVKPSKIFKKAEKEGKFLAI